MPHSRLALATLAVAGLAACASPPATRNAALDEARAQYERAAGDATVARSAPLDLRKAQQALQKADEAMSAGGDAAAVEHYAYLARQRSEVALQAGEMARAEQAVADASSERDRVLIDVRTREAQAQRKLADERLTAAQTARARVKSLEEQLDAAQTDRGMVLTLGDVLFDSGRAQLNPGAARTLEQLAAFMRENKQRTIEIEGYTDSVGSMQMNQVLSERRAIAVKNALIDRGIDPRRISARGFGPANPVASNDTSAGRQQNRRVEIVVTAQG